MAGRDDDFEFLPTDDLDEVEDRGPEDGAVHVHEPDESRELLTVEAEEFDADGLDEDEADELEVEAEEAEGTDQPGEAAVAPRSPAEREDDLQEVLRRQYGLVGEQPDDDLVADENVRPPRRGEFVCRSCFLRRPITQLADAAAGTCVDCAAADPVGSPGG
ncbi:MAG TPA: hypothetical protein VFZ77_14385 [Acidimicrobiales bacterium]